MGEYGKKFWDAEGKEEFDGNLELKMLKKLMIFSVEFHILSRLGHLNS
jgi:hypothetical protein